MTAYRGTEFELTFARDMETDFNIYMKKTDIQQVEAVLFYEYIKTTYGEVKIFILQDIFSWSNSSNMYIFYAKCNGDDVVTLTWNGLGSFGSVNNFL